MEFVAQRWLALDHLRRFPGNARRGDTEVIAASLARFGQYRSLVVREVGGGEWQIIAGNHTYDAIGLLAAMSEAQLLELYGREAAERWAEPVQLARCEIIACGDGEARRINLADNRTAELGGYDDDALAVLLAALDGDYAGTGWAEPDLAGLLPPEQGKTGPDDAPPVPADPVTRPGDVWQLGRHRLICGDASSPGAAAALGGPVPDCMWTDPPYGVDVVGGSRAVPAAERRKAGKLRLQGDGVAGLPALLAGAFTVATDYLAEGAAVYVCYPAHHRQLFDAAFTGAGWTYAQELIWVKGHVFSRTDYHYAHEGLIYGYTSGAAIRRNIRRGWWGGNDQSSVLDIPRPSRSDEHPSMKPAELVARCLQNSCPPGGTVYDPFAGSGSTLIAAHQLRMTARLVEIDPAYCDVICLRYAEFTGERPYRCETGVDARRPGLDGGVVALAGPGQGVNGRAG